MIEVMGYERNIPNSNGNIPSWWAPDVNSMNCSDKTVIAG